MAHRLLDRLWNRLVDRYDGDDGGDCGCGTGTAEAGGDARTSESDAADNSKQENAI